MTANGGARRGRAFGRGHAAGLLASALLLLSSCEDLRPTAPGPAASAPNPERQVATTSPVPPLGLSDESLALQAYYARVQDGLLEQGLLRRDDGAELGPLTQRRLVEDFVRIALFEEYANINGRIVARQTESALHRWDDPVRVSLSFGRTVPDGQRRTDRAMVSAYLDRLAKVTGHSIKLSSSDPNYEVYIVNEAERRLLGPEIEDFLPGISKAALDTVISMPRSTFCIVFAWDPGDTGRYSRAVAVIRGEHPDLLRLSCIHEELAQGLGLSNDSPSARPSIFNDDEEFALLTQHDELLLKMLYDDRMRAGMGTKEAREMAAIVAAELLADANM